MERFQRRRSNERQSSNYNQCSSANVNTYSDSSSLANLITGNVQIRRHIDAPEVVSETGSCSSGRTEEDSLAFKLRRSSSEQASGSLGNKLLAQELSKEMESRRHSPSVIARLMGLDALPPQEPVQKQPKKFSEKYVNRTSSVGPVEKNLLPDSRSPRVKKKEQEFKDVYEVLETSHTGDVSNLSSSKMGKSKSIEIENKLEFIRQKFIDVKRLSTDEKLHHSKEFHDALGVLDSNKDILLKFLQQPNPSFTKHVHDLQVNPPPPEAGQITILKSSNAHKYKNGDVYLKSGRNELKVADYCQTSQHGFVSCPQDRHNCHDSSKVPITRFGIKNEVAVLPTRIVVLKPNVGQLQNEFKTKSSEGYRSGQTKHREYLNSEYQDLYSEIGEQSQRFSPREVKLLKHRAQGSREIAKEITRQMRNSMRSSSSSKVQSSRLGGYAGDESSCSVNDSGDEPEVTTPTPRHLHDWKQRYSRSKSDSTESSVSREAKKRISERLKLSHGSQRAETVGRGNTLGKLLATTDRETRPMNLESMVGREGFTDKLAWNDGVANCGTPLGISSRDGWKDENARKLPRSRSLPASSTLGRSPRKTTKGGSYGSDRCSVPKEAVNGESDKYRKAESEHLEGYFSKNSNISGRRKSNSFLHQGRETNPTRRARTILDEPSKIIEEKDLLEKRPISLLQQDSGLDTTMSLSDEIVYDTPKNAETSSESPEMPEQAAYISLLGDGIFPLDDQVGPVPEELSTEAPEKSLHTPNCSITEPESPRRSREAEQPSPVSILEPPFIDESSPDSDCFESVSADLQGLRLQLQLLKLESSDAYSDDAEMTLSTDEETGEEGSHGFPNEERESIQRLRDETSRDFCYLIDVLIDSEVLDEEHYILPARWHSPDCPLGQHLFEKLEKNKYREQTKWPRSERKLLFDRINTGLIEIFLQHESPHPWINFRTKMGLGWRKERLEEEVWKVLVNEGKRVEREEESLENAMVLGKEIKWLELEDEMDMVGREIESILMNELLAEVAMNM